jgi:hypothetical protein
MLAPKKSELCDSNDFPHLNRIPQSSQNKTSSNKTQKFFVGQLLEAMNPCPCGHFEDAQKACTCSHQTVTRYQKRISGPMLDRIDIHIEVPRRLRTSYAIR